MSTRVQKRHSMAGLWLVMLAFFGLRMALAVLT